MSHVVVNDLVPNSREQDDEETYCEFLRNGSRTDFFTERIRCKESDRIYHKGKNLPNVLKIIEAYSILGIFVAFMKK